MEESLSKLFDSNDKSNVGKVAVSALISAVNDEYSNDSDINPLWLERGRAVLHDITHILDPLETDIFIDKDTWIAAWKQKAVLSEPIEDPENSSVLQSPNEGTLDESKQSYGFSPSSHSISVESEMYELATLKEENKQLAGTVKSLKEQIQVQEDLLAQDQMERKLEIDGLKDENFSLTRVCKDLKKRFGDLTLSLEESEREKMELHKIQELRNEAEKQRKIQLKEQTIEIDTLKKDIEELSRLNDNNKSRIGSLIMEKLDLTTYYEKMLKDLEESYQKRLIEQEEPCSKCICSQFQKASLTPQFGESEFNNNLQKELENFTLCAERHSPDGLLPNIDVNCSDCECAAIPNTVTTSSPNPDHIEMKSLLQEMTAASSFIQNDSSLNSSVDVQNHCCAQGDNELLGVNYNCKDLFTNSRLIGIEKIDRFTQTDSIQTSDVAVQACCEFFIYSKNQKRDKSIAIKRKRGRYDNPAESMVESKSTLTSSHIVDSEMQTEPQNKYICAVLQKNDQYLQTRKIIKNDLVGLCPTRNVEKLLNQSILQAGTRSHTIGGSDPSTLQRYNKWFYCVFIITTFFVLLVVMTIFLSAIILEEASLSGIFKPRYVALFPNG